MSLLFLLGILHLVVVSGSNDEVGEDQGYLLYCPCMGRWTELKITLLVTSLWRYLHKLLCDLFRLTSCLQVWQPGRPAPWRDGTGQGLEENLGPPSVGGICPWAAQAQNGAVGNILSGTV